MKFNIAKLKNICDSLDIDTHKFKRRKLHTTRLYKTYLTAVHVVTTKQSPKCRFNSHKCVAKGSFLNYLYIYRCSKGKRAV